MKSAVSITLFIIRLSPALIKPVMCPYSNVRTDPSRFVTLVLYTVDETHAAGEL